MIDVPHIVVFGSSLPSSTIKKVVKVRPPLIKLSDPRMSKSLHSQSGRAIAAWLIHRMCKLKKNQIKISNSISPDSLDLCSPFNKILYFHGNK